MFDTKIYYKYSIVVSIAFVVSVALEKNILQINRYTKMKGTSIAFQTIFKKENKEK